MAEKNAELVQTVYSEHLATMRTLEANAFSATLRIFMLDLLIAGGLMTEAVHLHTTGKVVASLLIVGFHFLMGWYLREKEEAYRTRKRGLRATKVVVVTMLPSLEDAIGGSKADGLEDGPKRHFKELAIYRWCLFLGGVFAVASVLFPRLLT